MNEIEELKELLGLPKEAVVLSVRKHRKEKGEKEYIYLNVNYELHGKTKQKYVKKDLEGVVIKLWTSYKKKKEELKKQIKQLLKLNSPDVLKEIINEVFKEEIGVSIERYNIQRKTTKAKELFKEFIGELVKLYREGVFKRLTILQVLYLLANLKELSESQDKPEYFFKKGINTIIRVARNERIPNPFGTLKNDFFLSGMQTPYDFLLSNFLEEIIGDTLTELLQKEVEKIEAQRKAKEYEEKMEKLKEIISWFENLPLEIKTMAREVISQNTLEIAERFLKEMEIEGYSLKEIQDFMEKARREDLIHYLSYLKEL